MRCVRSVPRVNTTNQPFSYTMIDRTTVKAPIKPFHRDDSSRFAQVIIAQHSQAKVKPTITYIDSPLTGSQIEITPSVERDVYDNDWLVLSIQVFVAANLVGQNYVHGDLSHIMSEWECVARFIRVIFNRERFTPEEIDFFLKHSKVQELEVCWHRQTASRRAARALLKRGLAHFQALETLSGRHDSLIEFVDVQTRKNRTTFLVNFKNGCQLRLYLKAEQSESRTKANRLLSFVAKALRPHVDAYEEAVDTKVRVEPIFSASYLESKGYQHPNSLTPEVVEGCIEELMAMARLDIPFATRLEDVDASNMSTELRETVAAYFDGQDLVATMAPHTFTRHRQALAPHGLELAVRYVKSRCALGSTLCKQLPYVNRWKPSAALLAHALTSDTTPGILHKLDALLPAESAHNAADSAEDGVIGSDDGHDGVGSHE